MKTKQGWPLGVCSWSLQQEIKDVAASLKKLGISHIHLALGPGIGKGGKAYIDFAKKQRWTITCGMIDFPQEDYSSLEAIRRTGGIVPDKQWPANRARFAKACDIATLLGTPYISFHAGFLDHGNMKYARKFFDRMNCLADIAAERKLILLMETGQESAADLSYFLDILEHPAVGVNFDPANMILYNKDEPVDAVKILSPWIRHIHIKDAIRTKKPGTWGMEVPWGDGQAGGSRFLKMLEKTGFKGAVAIEREAGDQRFADIKLAIKRLR